MVDKQMLGVAFLSIVDVFCNCVRCMSAIK